MLIQATSEKAQASGALSSLSISHPITVTDQGIGFLLSHSGSAVATSAMSNKNTASTVSSNPVPTLDPFDKNNLDERLVVTKIAPSYTLILNKFNTIQDHVSAFTMRN